MQVAGFWLCCGSIHDCCQIYVHGVRVDAHLGLGSHSGLAGSSAHHLGTDLGTSKGALAGRSSGTTDEGGAASNLQREVGNVDKVPAPPERSAFLHRILKHIYLDRTRLLHGLDTSHLSGHSRCHGHHLCFSEKGAMQCTTVKLIKRGLLML